MPLPTDLHLLEPLRLEQIRLVQVISETMMMNSGWSNIARIIMKALNPSLPMLSVRTTAVPSSSPRTNKDRVSTLKSRECFRLNISSLDVTKAMFAREIGPRTPVLH